MRKLFKDHILHLKRYQTSEGRDIEGLRLDRNERVDPLPQDVIDEIFSQFKVADFAAHPESPTLYEKVSEFLDISQDQIYLLNGITEGINVLFSTLCTPKHNVVVLDPTYPMYSIYASLHDVEYRPFIYSEDLTPDMASFKNALDANTAFVVVANPNLPVESAFALDEIREIAERCAENGSALIIDEAYHYFGADSALGLIDEFDNLVIMRTFSKAFGLASARIGFMISSRENIEYLSKTRSLVESNTFSMGIAGYMLDHPEIMQEHVKAVKEGAAYLQTELDREGLRWHGGNFTNGILVFLDGIGKPNDLIDFMRERKIYIRGAFAPPFDSCTRISIGSRAAMESFMNAFRQWKAGVSSGKTAAE